MFPKWPKNGHNYFRNCSYDFPMIAFNGVLAPMGCGILKGRCCMGERAEGSWRSEIRVERFTNSAGQTNQEFPILPKANISFHEQEKITRIII